MNKTTKRILALTGTIAMASAAAFAGTAQAAGKSVVIGFQGPLTGSDAQAGQDELTGANYALWEYNQTNPAVKVTIKQIDDEGDGSKAAVVAPGIAADKTVIGVVGSAYSGASLNSFPAYRSAGLTMVSPSASRVSLTAGPSSKDSGFPIFHRVVASDKYQGPALARYAVKGVSSPKVYLVDDQSPYGAGLASYVKGGLTAAGATLAGSDSVLAPATDYSATAAKVKSSGANVVIYCGYYSDAGLFVKALRDGGYTGIFASGDGTLNADFVKVAGKAAAEGARLTAADVPFEKIASASQLANFLKVAGVKVPGTYVTNSYDAMNVFLTCIKQGKTTRPAIANCVNNGSFPALNGGTIKFSRYGDQLNPPPVGGYTIKDGAIAYVALA